MSEPTDNILFTGRLAASETFYIEVPIRDGRVGLQIAWPDAVSSAAITLELTSFLSVSATVAGAGRHWKDSGVSITGPAASAEGSSVVNVANVLQRRARLKIITAAVTFLEILDGLERKAA
jgi:hypothetical protein